MVDNRLPQSYKYPLVKTKKEMLIEGKSLYFVLLTYKYFEQSVAPRLNVPTGYCWSG